MFWACYHKGQKHFIIPLYETIILLHKYVQVSMPCLNKIEKL